VSLAEFVGSARLDWLESCCSGELLSRPDWMKRPALLQFRGELWSVATDGWVVLALRGVTDGLELNATWPESVAKILAVDRPHSVSPLATWPSLGEFLADATTVRAIRCPKGCPVATGQAEDCPECLGQGVVEDDAEDDDFSDCPFCGGAGYAWCRECEGDGAIRTPASPGVIAPGVVVDRNILKRALGPLCNAPIRIGYGGQLEAVTLEDETLEWRIVIMPMRENSDGLPTLAASRVLGAA
jgi:hypothetical protein